MGARFGPNAWLQGGEAPRVHRLTLAAVAAIALTGLVAIGSPCGRHRHPGRFQAKTARSPSPPTATANEFEIYAMGADGQNPTRLTNNAGTTPARLLPRRHQDRFHHSTAAATNEIYVMDADGQNPTNLTNNAANR